MSLFISIWLQKAIKNRVVTMSLCLKIGSIVRLFTCNSRINSMLYPKNSTFFVEKCQIYLLFSTFLFLFHNFSSAVLLSSFFTKTILIDVRMYGMFHRKN